WALEASTGKLLWKTIGDYRARVTLDNGAVYAPVSRGPDVAVRVLRPRTGDSLWTHGFADLWKPPPDNPNGHYHDGAIVRSGHRLYTGTRTGSLLCLDAAT